MLDRRAAAARLGVSLRTLDTLLARNTFTTYRPGRRVFLFEREVDAYIEAHTVRSPAGPRRRRTARRPA